jgi:hypothetical protein
MVLPSMRHYADESTDVDYGQAVKPRKARHQTLGLPKESAIRIPPSPPSFVLCEGGSEESEWTFYLSQSISKLTCVAAPHSTG